MAQADSHIEDLGIHFYATPVGTLAVGVPFGEKRPALWVVLPSGPWMLGRLDSEYKLKALVNLLDAAFDEINQVTSLYRALAGDPNGKKHSRSNN